MKNLIALLCTVSLSVAAVAGPDHDHGPKIKAGPNGGRILTKVEPHAEFLVTPERKVKITFLDGANQPVAPKGQVVSVTTGDRMSPTKLTFVAAGDALVSEQALPEGNAWPAVVQIRASAESKPMVEKFTINLAICSGCKRAEYACTCGHSH